MHEIAKSDLRHIISRQVIVWLIAVIWVAIALFMWLAVIGPANLPVIIAEPVQAGTESKVRDDYAPQPALFTVHDARAENLGRLGEAVMAFATAGLDLPTLDIWFYTDSGPCEGYHGVFRTHRSPGRSGLSRLIKICSSDINTVYEHELAHAWVSANVTDTQRFAFMDMRRLKYWADGNVSWNERGTEWAAVIIQQGVNGLPLPPVLSNETKSRLESYELLTGRAAPILVDWIRGRDVPCTDRPTNLSRLIDDRNGRNCVFSSASLRGLHLIAQTDADGISIGDRRHPGSLQESGTRGNPGSTS